MPYIKDTSRDWRILAHASNRSLGIRQRGSNRAPARFFGLSNGRGMMMTGWKIGTIATLAGSTAMALAMVAGAGSARADELADLRANQELLSQRIDQLAQGQSIGPTGPIFSVNQNPAAGSPSLAGSFPRSFLIPGTETSLKIGGQITEVLDYWLSGGNPNTSPQSTTVG